MRRWNGWGDEAVLHPLPRATGGVLESLLGPGRPPRDATLAEALAAAAAPRLPAGRLASADPLERLLHARGQSFPDLVALRSGAVGALPDLVAYPAGDADVRELLAFAAETGARVVPYGGGTSVVGHVNPVPGDAPTVTVDLRRMRELRDLDPVSRLATFAAGVTGPDLEAQLRARGLTLGHYPQSFERSTLGGWVATRSVGHQALGYGRIDELFAGGRLESPAGRLELPPFPASAAGPDLRQVVLGSEGRLGVLTEVTVRVRPVPEREAVHAVAFPDWERGLGAVRSLAQANAAAGMLRLSGPAETAFNLALAGRERLVALASQLLAARGVRDGRCLLLASFSGGRQAVRAALGETLAEAARHGGVHLGTVLGRQWRHGRFRAPYWRDLLWERGYGVDTVETAAPWSRVPALVDAVERALAGALEPFGDRAHAFTHLSHPYPSGSSAYTTFVFRLGSTPDETLGRWQALRAAASAEILERGGTISHQHGVGVDHRAHLVREKGPLGVDAVRGLAAVFDPGGLMNPGKLV